MFERRVMTVMIGMVGLTVWLAGADPAAGGATTRIASGGDVIEMEIPSDVGMQKETLPLYRSGTIHYFSAGIGLVEREAAYPPFPLKLVFTAGGKSFVTGVEVVLRRSKSATVLTVPREHVTGPWLFIDVPDGTYEVAATLGGQIKQVKGIDVRRGHITTQHVRWAEDRSPALPPQAE